MMEETKLPALWSGYYNSLRLSGEFFNALRLAKNGLWYTIQIFLVVALLASLGTLASASNATQEVTLGERIGSLAERIQALANTLPGFLSGPVQGAADRASQLASAFTAVQPPLGAQPSQYIRLVGEWLATPLALLGLWFGAGMATWVMAVWMGAGGKLRQHMSLFLLCFAPQLLTFLNYIPASLTGNSNALTTAAGLLNFAAIAWSLVIAVWGIAIAHEIPTTRAALILILAALIVLVVFPFLLSLLGGAAIALLLSLVL